MMWIFKGDDGRYLHSFGIGPSGGIEGARWADEQQWAYRFTDHNRASEVTYALAVPGVLKTLLPSGMRKFITSLNQRLDVVEANNDATRAWITGFANAARRPQAPPPEPKTDATSEEAPK